MLERLSTSLFHTRLIGKYITDKVWKVILYLLFITLIAAMPVFIFSANSKLINDKDYNSFQTEYLTQEKSACITNYELNDESFYLETSDFIFSFNHDDLSFTKWIIAFNKNEVSFYAYGLKMSSMSYKSLDIKELKLDDINKNYHSMQAFEGICNKLVDDSRIKVEVVYDIQAYFILLGEFILVGLILFCVAKFANPKIPARFIVPIAIYSLSSLAIGELLYYATRISLVEYLGILMSGIAVIRAATAILKIEVRKNK